MFKLFILLLLLAGSFAGGYYMGQQPKGTFKAAVTDLSKQVARSEDIVGDVRQSLQTLSRDAINATLQIEQDLRRRQGLVEAKSQLVQAKADLLDKNFGDAARELAEAANALETATKGEKTDDPIIVMKSLSSSLRELRQEMATGKSVSVKKLNDLQQRLDQLLNQ